MLMELFSLTEALPQVLIYSSDLIIHVPNNYPPTAMHITAIVTSAYKSVFPPISLAVSVF